MLHYLDNAATTPVRSEAVTAAVDAMTQWWGNPSSRHQLGGDLTARIKEWRGQVAVALGCLPEEVYFTSCGTEGDNWAIQGAIHMGRHMGKHIITTTIEHSAVLAPIAQLEKQGYEVTYLTPNAQGTIDADAVAKALRPDTVLVSMMLVNNELGTILPVREAADAILSAGSFALLHCDGVQGFLKMPFTPKDLGVDFMAISGHKIHAPKGIGVLYIKKGRKLPPMIQGGGQELGLRSGTEPTAQIAAFAAAVTAGKETMEQDIAHMNEIKAYAIDQIKTHLPQVQVLLEQTVAHILPISMVGYKSEVLVRFLSDRGVCVSSGSACHRGKASHVFGAMKLSKPVQDGVLRVSFSYDSTKEDVDKLIEGLQEAGKILFPSLS